MRTKKNVYRGLLVAVMLLGCICPSKLLEARNRVSSSSKRQATSERFKKDRIQAAQKLDLLKSQYELARQFLQAESDLNQKAAELLVLVDNAYAWLVESGLQPKSFVLNRTLFAKAFSATKSELLPETVESLALLLKASRTRRISPGAIAGISIASVAALVTLVAVMMAAKSSPPRAYSSPQALKSQTHLGLLREFEICYPESHPAYKPIFLLRDADPIRRAELTENIFYQHIITCSKANTRVTDAKGVLMTPLMLAMIYCPQMVTPLLKAGANPVWSNEGDSREKVSFNAYAFAIEIESPQLLRSLLKFDSKFINNKLESGDTLVHRAVSISRESPSFMSNELLKVLISFGADIDEADKHGFTPLALLAAKQGEPADRTIPLMKLLLDNGADIFPKSLNGKVRLHGSPLHFSISLCNSQVLEFFIKRIHASGSREEKEKLKENFQECSNEIMNMYRWMGKLAQNSAVEKMLQECGLLGSVGVGDSVAP